MVRDDIKVWAFILLGFLTLLTGVIAYRESNPPRETYPARVLIIRHAEDPDSGDDPVGVSKKGKERAEALPGLFRKTADGPARFPTPDYIFAARDTRHSHRSTQTVAVLEKDLHLNGNHRYDDEDFRKLAHELFSNPEYEGKTVLICWHHGTAPALARELKAADAPDHWKGSAYNRVWEITYDDNGQATCRDLPQKLLPGDK